jgi:hypothetical protein
MTRLRAAIVLAVIAIVVTLAFWWLRTPAASATPVVRVLVGGLPTATIEAGSPLFVEVFLHGGRAARGPAIGGWLRPWHQSITVTLNRDGQALPLSFVSTAAPRGRETGADGLGRPTVIDRDRSRADLDGLRRVFRIELAAAPESTRSLAPGAYQLVAAVEPPAWQLWSWRGRVQSSPAIVTITNTPSERTAADTAAFLYKTRRFPDAIRVARDWNTRDPKSIGARLILGDALIETGDLDGARDAWETALDLANAKSEKEPATAILRRLDRLRTRQ